VLELLLDELDEDVLLDVLLVVFGVVVVVVVFFVVVVTFGAGFFLHG
jgi:hypothetical protein